MISRIAADGKKIVPTIIKQNSNTNEYDYIEDLDKKGISLIKKECLML